MYQKDVRTKRNVMIGLQVRSLSLLIKTGQPKVSEMSMSWLLAELRINVSPDVLIVSFETAVLVFPASDVPSASPFLLTYDPLLKMCLPSSVLPFQY